MTAKKKLTDLARKYSHIWVLLYGFIYMPWFCWLENRRGVRHFFIHSPLDDQIPFIEYFVIPYLLWFIFIVATAAYFFFTDKK